MIKSFWWVFKRHVCLISLLILVKQTPVKYINSVKKNHNVTKGKMQWNIYIDANALRIFIVHSFFSFFYISPDIFVGYLQAIGWLLP